MTEHFYRPSEGHRLAHDPLNSIVAPRPIGWIGTLSSDGVRNLAPYSFFNLLSYRPALLGFSSDGFKDTVRNCQDTGEFTWNLVTRPLAARMNQTSTMRSVDEFEFAGLTPAASREISAPRVAESPVSFECRVTQLFVLEGLEEPSGNWFTVGEVVGVHIDESVIVDGSFDTLAADPALRAGGPTAYYGIGPSQRFDYRRPD